MRLPDEGPYMRKRTVRVFVTDGQDTKKTALVNEPDTF